MRQTERGTGGIKTMQGKLQTEIRNQDEETNAIRNKKCLENLGKREREGEIKKETDKWDKEEKML